jgi:hypothetical protein
MASDLAVAKAVGDVRPTGAADLARVGGAAMLSSFVPWVVGDGGIVRLRRPHRVRAERCERRTF